MRKDNEIRNSGKGEGLDHTTPEFQKISKILATLLDTPVSPLWRLKLFIKKTSINRRTYNYLSDKWRTAVNTVFEKHIIPFQPQAELSDLYLDLTKGADYYQLFTSSDAADRKILQKAEAKGKKAFVVQEKAGFIYYSQRDLVVKRYKYAQYLQQGTSDDEYIIAFNQVDDEHFKIGKYPFFFIGSTLEDVWNATKVLFNFLFPQLSFSINKLKKLYSKIQAHNFDLSYMRYQMATRLYYFRQWDFTNFSEHLKQSGSAVTEFDKDSFTGWSYRRYHNYATLLIVSLLFIFGLIGIIIGTRFANGNAFDIGNSIATSMIAISTLFLGTSLIGMCWQIPHDLKHQLIERKRYQKEIGYVAYRLHLMELLEKIELEINEALDNPTCNGDILKHRIKELVKEKFSDPANNNKIENTIANMINRLPNKIPFIQDILDNSGEQLQQARIRRSYVKRLFGTNIKQALQDETCYRMGRHYGFFDKKIFSSPFEKHEEQAQDPIQCYRFNELIKII